MLVLQHYSSIKWQKGAAVSSYLSWLVPSSVPLAVFKMWLILNIMVFKAITYIKVDLIFMKCFTHIHDSQSMICWLLWWSPDFSSRTTSHIYGFGHADDSIQVKELMCLSTASKSCCHGYRLFSLVSFPFFQLLWSSWGLCYCLWQKPTDVVLLLWLVATVVIVVAKVI